MNYFFSIFYSLEKIQFGADDTVDIRSIFSNCESAIRLELGGEITKYQ